MRIRIVFLSGTLVLLAGLATSTYFRPYEPITSNSEVPVRGSYHIHSEASHDGFTSAFDLNKSAENLGLVVYQARNLACGLATAYGQMPDTHHP